MRSPRLRYSKVPTAVLRKGEQLRCGFLPTRQTFLDTPFHSVLLWQCAIMKSRPHYLGAAIIGTQVCSIMYGGVNLVSLTHPDASAITVLEQR